MKQFEKAPPFEINAEFQYVGYRETVESLREVVELLEPILANLEPGEVVTVRRPPPLDEMTDRQEFAAEMDRAELKEKRVPYE